MKARVAARRSADSTAVPAVAAVLGVAGLLPFVAASAALLFESPAPRTIALTALLVYGAVILGFMGAIHWGLALRLEAHLRDAKARWFSVSVVPALVGWMAALMGLLEKPVFALLLLAAGFMFAYVVDVKSVRANIAPRWYLRLRRPLTTAVLLCLGAAGLSLLAAG